jgi:hypothetical protein
MKMADEQFGIGLGPSVVVHGRATETVSSCIGVAEIRRVRVKPQKLLFPRFPPGAGILLCCERG